MVPYRRCTISALNPEGVQVGRKAQGVWRRTQDGYWYGTVAGQKVKLSQDRDEAEQLWHELKSKERAPELKDFNPFKVVAELFLDRVLEECPESYKHYRFYLQSFSDAFPDILVKDITATHVRRWQNSHATWGDSTRKDAVTNLVACLNWAAKPENNLIGNNPIRGMSRGTTRSRGAETLIEPDDYQRLYDAANPALRRVLFALRQTGARPSAVCRITAQDCHFAEGVIRLEQHKTGRKTGRAQLIPMTEPLKAMLLDLARQYPEGPLFRTVRGRPYTPAYLSEHVGRMQSEKRKWPVRLSKRVICYGFRHTVATELLEGNVPDAKVAAILGHANTAMIYRHYGHLGAKIKNLRDEMERVLNGGNPDTASGGGGKVAPGG
jgi:integrase